MVRAFEQGEDRSQFWENAHTVASGLRVPKPLGDFLILEAVRASGGTAIAVSDSDAAGGGRGACIRRGHVRRAGRRRLRGGAAESCWPAAF